MIAQRKRKRAKWTKKISFDSFNTKKERKKERKKES